MSAAFDLAHVTVVRSGTALLADVSWRAEPGDRWVVIGANGAGKSTLMQIVGATMFPTSGTAEVLGELLGEVDVFDLRTRIGFTGTTVADRIPAAESVHDAVMSAAHAVTGRWNEEYESEDLGRADQILGELGIRGLANRTFATL
jgi:iron complex transport system ATP-binding protein